MQRPPSGPHSGLLSPIRKKFLFSARHAGLQAIAFQRAADLVQCRVHDLSEIGFVAGRDDEGIVDRQRRDAASTKLMLDGRAHVAVDPLQRVDCQRPRALVDLRLQSRSKEIHALTRDGILVKAKVSAKFQIRCQEAEDGWLYPFDSEAVFAAIHAQGVCPEGEEGGEELGWDQIVIDRAANLVQDGLARTLLDQLLEGDEVKAIGDAAKKELAQTMALHGIDVKGVSLGGIQVEDETVLKQRVQGWRASWERRRTEREARREAEATRLIEQARADAQRQMITSITEALQQLKESGTPVPAHVIALRFIDVLEDVATSQSVKELLPEGMEEIPAQLRLLVEQTVTGDEDETAQ